MWISLGITYVHLKPSCDTISSQLVNTPSMLVFRPSLFQGHSTSYSIPAVHMLSWRLMSSFMWLQVM